MWNRFLLNFGKMDHRKATQLIFLTVLNYCSKSLYRGGFRTPPKNTKKFDKPYPSVVKERTVESPPDQDPRKHLTINPSNLTIISNRGRIIFKGVMVKMEDYEKSAASRIDGAIRFSIEREGITPDQALQFAKETVGELKPTCDWAGCSRPTMDQTEAWATHHSYCKPHDRKACSRV